MTKSLHLYPAQWQQPPGKLIVSTPEITWVMLWWLISIVWPRSGKMSETSLGEPLIDLKYLQVRIIMLIVLKLVMLCWLIQHAFIIVPMRPECDLERNNFYWLTVKLLYLHGIKLILAGLSIAYAICDVELITYNQSKKVRQFSIQCPRWPPPCLRVTLAARVSLGKIGTKFARVNFVVVWGDFCCLIF